jgi:hypothetical protein
LEVAAPLDVAAELVGISGASGDPPAEEERRAKPMDAGF